MQLKLERSLFYADGLQPTNSEVGCAMMLRTVSRGTAQQVIVVSRILYDASCHLNRPWLSCIPCGLAGTTSRPTVQKGLALGFPTVMTSGVILIHFVVKLLSSPVPRRRGSGVCGSLSPYVLFAADATREFSCRPLNKTSSKRVASVVGTNVPSSSCKSSSS